MYGSILGNTISTLYFLIFQIAGILLANLLLKKEPLPGKIILGSAMGSFLLQWLPVFFSFPLHFNILSHVVALFALVPIFYFGLAGCKPAKALKASADSAIQSLKKHWIIVLLWTLTMGLWIFLLSTHTLEPAGDGSLHCGQCTYGDMNMHLSFITSIAVQQKFPPDYSIFPGVRLAYPFLSDSISSSLYVFGASLRYAYILPMIAAFSQIMGTVYLFAYEFLRSRAKALFAWILFFFNGGFGFAYFLDWSSESKIKFTDIFTEYYSTPTNLAGNNIRWVNIIADMFLPQRATLFGYAIAIPCIYILYRAVFSKITSARNYFLVSGILLGGLPLVHTHSFLASGLIAASWLLYVLVCNREKIARYFSSRILFTFYLTFMLVIAFLMKNQIVSDDFLMPVAIAVFGLIILFGILMLMLYLQDHNPKDLLTSWGLFLLCALLFALPQLLFWTFGQVSEGGFVRGHFNWGNQGDSYLWFYLKNFGMPFFLILGAAFSNRPKVSKLLLPAGVIWLLAELVVFTPNTYDNNKLLYLAYLLLLLAAVDYAAELYHSLKALGSTKIFAAIILIACTLSGVLTLGREVVSDYRLYGSSLVKLAEFVEENTKPNAVFLTGTSHINPIASLTGRNIVCGADIYLFFHGIDTSQRKKELRLMYEAPSNSQELFQKYNIRYVVISEFEASDYTPDYGWFDSNCSLIFSDNSVRLYQLAR